VCVCVCVCVYNGKKDSKDERIYIYIPYGVATAR
jgi:hypothetical protein